MTSHTGKGQRAVGPTLSVWGRKSHRPHHEPPFRPRTSPTGTAARRGTVGTQHVSALHGRIWSPEVQELAVPRALGISPHLGVPERQGCMLLPVGVWEWGMMAGIEKLCGICPCHLRDVSLLQSRYPFPHRNSVLNGDDHPGWNISYPRQPTIHWRTGNKTS